MPVIRDIGLSLKTKEVLRRAGFGKHSKIRPEIKSLIFELLANVKEAHLLEPAVAYEIYSVTEMRRRQLSLEDSGAVQGLLEAKELAAVVCTIGAKLEKQVTDYFNRDEPLRGVLLDGIGNAAVDSLNEEVCTFINDEALSRGYQASIPISPGIPGLPMKAQWQLLQMVAAREIGVRLTCSGVMVPRKSVSLVIGLGRQMKTWKRAEICAHCNLKNACVYRIQA